MGAQLGSAAWCESGVGAVANIGQVDTKSFLRPGDRQWVPASYEPNRLLFGVDFTESWVHVDASIVLFGEDGTILGLVGPRGLGQVDGVSMDCISGKEVLKVCLSRLSDSVRGLALVASPATSSEPAGRRTSTSGLPSNSAGSCEAYIAVPISGPVPGEPTQAAAADGSKGSPAQKKLVLRIVCRIRPTVPKNARGAAVVLLALHSGADRGERWHVEAVGKHLMPISGSKRAPVDSFVADLALKNLHLQGSEKPEASLPETSEIMVPEHHLEPGESKIQRSLAESLAMANKVAGEKRREAERERQKSALLQQALGDMKERYGKVFNDGQKIRYGVEAWRRRAMLKVQSGEPEQVASMLSELPAAMPPEGQRQRGEELPRETGQRQRGEELPRETSSTSESPSPRRQGPLKLDRLLMGNAGELLPHEMRASPSSPTEAGASGKKNIQSLDEPVVNEELWEDPKLALLMPRAGDPLVSRPYSSSLGDMPMDTPMDEAEDPSGLFVKAPVEPPKEEAEREEPKPKSEPPKSAAARLEPRPAAVPMEDPRAPGQEVNVVAFYYPGKEEVWDTMCGAGFLGNFYDLGPGGLELEAPLQAGRKRLFRNAEAAFQALKWWVSAGDFAELTGEEAFLKKQSLSQPAKKSSGGSRILRSAKSGSSSAPEAQPDLTYAGYGSNWKGMMAVLGAKFAPRTAMAEGLLRTGSAFLLEHNPVEGRDSIWSDNHNGEGKNWLGLQLMLIRDRLSGDGAWTKWIERLIDTDTGSAKSAEKAKTWQAAVVNATSMLAVAISSVPAPSAAPESGRADAEAPPEGARTPPAPEEPRGFAGSGGAFVDFAGGEEICPPPKWDLEDDLDDGGKAGKSASRSKSASSRGRRS